MQGARTELTGLPGAQRMTLAIGFGRSAQQAKATARASLATGFDRAAADYASTISDWSYRRPICGLVATLAGGALSDPR